MWKKDLQNSDLKLSRKGLLSEAVEKYRALPEDIKKYLPVISTVVILKDDYGSIAVETDNHFFVAKKNPYGDIVSVHKTIWDLALERNKKLMMYLKSNESFYEFNPLEISDTTPNQRGEATMINFDLRAGVNKIKMAKMMALGEKPAIEPIERPQALF